MTHEIQTGRLEGKVAFVAGGSGGINLAIAERLAAEGAKVAIISRTAEKVAAATESIAAGGGVAWGEAVDVRNYEAVESSLSATRERFGPIDILVSGAAGNFLAPAATMSPNAFRTVVDIDLFGTFNVFRAGFPLLSPAGASLIAITAPQGAHPRLLQAHACAAKAGINMLTKCLAMEWGANGVRVNAISPGPIAETEGMMRLAGSSEQEAALKAQIAMRRYGTTSEIADLASFLASDASSYITGAIIDCDGGFSLGDASSPVS